MEQNILFLSVEEKDLILKNALIDNQIIDKETIDRVISRYNRLIKFAKEEIQGKSYCIDYFEKKFHVINSFDNEILESFDLPGNLLNQSQIKYNPEEWESWGNSFLILDSNELNKSGDINFDKENLYGLTINENITYLQNTDLEKQQLLANTEQMIFGARPKNKNVYLPFDIYSFPEKNIICLVNRGEGKIFIYNTVLKTFTDEIFARAAGSNKAINLALSPKENKIYITDNVSQMLGLYDLEQKSYSYENISIGVLGNIVSAPDNNSFYVVITRPEPSLKQLSFRDYQEIKEFPLKGDLFSQLDDPCDLMSVSPDKKYLAFMTYLDMPVPYTPVITIIDLEKNKAIKRFSIKDDTKPVNITFGSSNPVGALNKTLKELLLEEGLITPEKIKEVMDNIAKQEETVEEIEGVVKVENQVFDFEVQSETTSNEQGDFKPRKTKHVIISPKVNKFIIEVLLGSFWQKYEVDLTEHSEQMEELEKIAENSRKKMEFYDSDIVNISNFFEKKSLNAIIMREYILEMFSEEESKKATEVKTAPSKCLNCGTSLLGSWDCMVCGFKMERPEDVIKKKYASFEHVANLQKGNFLVIGQNNIVAEITQYKTQVWQLPLSELQPLSIVSAYRLENKNTIVLDKVKEKISEVSYKGRVTWEYKIKNSEDKLSSPSGFTMLNDGILLIADTGNNRIIESDLDGKIIWQYSKDLNKPYDIQKTCDDTYLVTDYGNNRILELSKYFNSDKNTFDFNVIWQYGNSLNIESGGAGKGKNELNKPVSAFKEADGNYIIVDSGNKRVLIVNEQKNIIWQYDTIQENKEISINSTSRVTRLKNNNLLIVGDNKVIEITQGEESKIQWFSNLDGLGTKKNLEKAVQTDKKHDNSFVQNLKSEPIKAKTEEKKANNQEIKKSEKAHDLKVEQEDELLTEEKKDIKKVNATQYIRDSRDVKDEEPVIEEVKKEPIKKVNASHYMKDIKEVKTEEAIETASAPESEKLNAIIEEKKKQLVLELKNGIRPKTNTPKVDDKLISFPIMITDKSKNTVSIIKRTGEVIWSYGSEKDEKIRGLIYSVITSNKTVLVTEIDRVFEINLSNKNIIWEYNCNANSAIRLKNGNTLIVDEANIRVIEIDPENKIVWEYKETDKKNQPHCALRLGNGNTLITYCIASKIKEVNSAKEEVWSFGSAGILFFPEYAYRLKNGNTLISDTENSRVIEVDENKNIVWNFSGTSNTKLRNPTYASRLINGNTFIVHSNNKQILEIDSTGQDVWNYSQ